MAEQRTWTWRHAMIESDLPATTKFVLSVLSFFMSDVGTGCYPTIAVLANRCSLSKKTVGDHLRSACALGWIKRRKHGFSGQKWASYEYEPAWPKGSEAGSPPSEKGGEGGSSALPRDSEPGDRKVVKEVHTNIPTNIPKSNSHTRERVRPGNAESLDDDRILVALREAAGSALMESAKGLNDVSAPLAWLDNGANLYRDVLPAIAERCRTLDAGSIYCWKYFDRVIADAAQSPTTSRMAVEPRDPATVQPRQWRYWLKHWINGGCWFLGDDAPLPLDPGCPMPVDVLQWFLDQYDKDQISRRKTFVKRKGSQ